MRENGEYAIHTDYAVILGELGKLKGVDTQVLEKARALIASLEEVNVRLKPVLKRQSFEEDETKLWSRYQELQKERLALLDLSHEWDYLEEAFRDVGRDFTILVRDAIQELIDHVEILGETYRAHIDILEIKNSRRLSLMALLTSIVISYVALWEFFAREFILTLQFPLGLSPYANYVLLLLSLTPPLAAAYWVWRQRVIR